MPVIAFLSQEEYDILENLPFILYRRQFPIVLAFAITINKSQGQSLEKVGIYFERPLFSHGQLFVVYHDVKMQTNYLLRMVLKFVMK